MSETQQQSDPPPMPSWIDRALIQRALQNDGEETAEVAEISVRLATAPGDNYGSTIYRAKAALAGGGERSFIIKGPPTGAMAEGSKESGIFRREAAMLAEVVPQMQAILEEAAPGRFPPMVPRCPLSGEEPEEHIVMEDLAVSHFRTADRKRGLGLRHCLLAFRTLARFHAASHALLRRQPELSERLDNLLKDKGVNAGMRMFVEGSIQTAVEAFHSWEGFERYGDILEKFQVGFMDRLVDVLDPRPGGFHVIAHSDFWTNNMMFRYEEDSPVELRFVDLQLTHVASPATDLLYFLAASASEVVHINHQQLLLREYHHELTDVLALLGLQAPSFEELQEDLDHHGLISVYIALCGLPVIRSEGKSDVDGLLQGDSSNARAPLEKPFVKR